MPFIFLVFGALLIIAGYRGKLKELGALVRNDFTGLGSFWIWILALGAIGAVGYIERLRPVSDAFLVLVLVALFVSNKGFFTQLQAQLRSVASGSGGISVSPLPPLPNYPTWNYNP